MEQTPTKPTEAKEAPELEDSEVLEASESPQKGAVDKLEEEIESAYNLVEASFSKLWTNASQNAQNLQEKIDIEKHKSTLLSQINSTKEYLSTNESIQDKVKATEKQVNDVKSQIANLEAGVNLKSLSQSANDALDSLDSKLEFVEQKAGQFVSSFTSFLSSVVSTAPPSEPKAPEPIAPEPTRTTSTFINETYGTSRYEADLFKLHTTEDPYLVQQLEVPESFDVESKTAEISGLLKQYPDTLAKTMNALVPVKVSYKEFWYRYFENESTIRSSDKARKELLAKKEKSSTAEKPSQHITQASDKQEAKKEEEDDEEFTWDDEDDE